MGPKCLNKSDIYLILQITMATELCSNVLRDGSCCGEDFLTSTNRTVM